jgi:hypothetical protein
MRKLPHPKNGGQTTAIDIRTIALMAQELVAGLESPSSENLCICCKGKLARKNPTGPIRTVDPDPTNSI